ncbi:hypothetical protein OIU84_005753 [Salix udensis]|uniref:Mannan endo-1,4-beta-mannosidase n=1 Tax=Salix udensis TaxID=889485 RepID=A0AAD6P1L4_9ROSI|nr:hypothetical protein OIU84_005753 [Salix udensis]
MEGTIPALKLKQLILVDGLSLKDGLNLLFFDGITNKDFLDGTGLQFKSVTVGKYLCAEAGGGNIIVANRTSASGWETFSLWRINATNFNFRVFNKQFVGFGTNGNGIEIVAVSSTPGRSETFEIVRSSNDSSRVRIKASNGFFLQAKTEELVTADYAGESKWGDDDPSVFVMTIAGRLQGEFQVTNGYGPELAPGVMTDHWRTFIRPHASTTLCRRAPLRALDNAFVWAQNHGLKVVIDLHAAPGSQNGWEHSSSRDGSQEWGQTDANIQQTVDVIDFLAARYAKSPSLYAVELINEPRAPGASLDSVTRYYKAGYDAVRKHSSTAYVVMSNRLSSDDPRELFPLASGLTGSVIDVHYYNLFSDVFNSMSVQQNIDFINTNRSADLSFVTTSNGPLSFVGEWVAEWAIQGATKEDYQRFAKAQLEVFGRASFGWAYWTLKNVNNHWSLEWMIKNGYIKL